MAIDRYNDGANGNNGARGGSYPPRRRFSSGDNDDGGMYGRIPPQNIEAEMAVLGAMSAIARLKLKRNVVAKDYAHEIEANAFASELLIPQAFLDAEVVGRQIDMEDDSVIDDLARRFQVSVAAMRFRLQG